MNRFGVQSRKELQGCHRHLQAVAPVVLRIKDHSIIKGHRGEQEQNQAFEDGASELQWPDGKHNQIPSLAMDVQTYPRPATEEALREEQLYLLGLYRGVGETMDITIRTGADWDQDGEIEDNGFDDFFHVEVIV